jgi:hypothetical protein
MITKILKEFLYELNQNEDWTKLVIEIELQPAFFGVSGYCLVENKNEISLRTKTTDDFDKTIKDFHLNNSNAFNKWNKIHYSVDKIGNENLSLIWDSVWQEEIDSENRKVKEQNPDYKLPKWHWEA